MQQQQQQAAPVVPAPGAAPHLPGATLHLQHNPHVAQMQQIDADVQIAFRGYNMQKPFADVQDAMTRLLPFHVSLRAACCAARAAAARAASTPAMHDGVPSERQRAQDNPVGDAAPSAAPCPACT
jgi:hypothetical protein